MSGGVTQNFLSDICDLASKAGMNGLNLEVMKGKSNSPMRFKMNDENGKTLRYLDTIQEIQEWLDGYHQGANHG